MTCINRDTIIYHTETQADYDALMVELDKQGCEWTRGVSTTIGLHYWERRKYYTCVVVRKGRTLENYTLREVARIYPNTPIQKYKAKADDKMKFTKENVCKLAERYSVNQGYLIGDLKSDIFKLDDAPKKVVVPKFVAEWIEWNKEAGADLQIILKSYRNYYDDINFYSDEAYSKKAVQWYVDNPYKFIQAYENGYTIEPEQLYYIPLPHLETTDGIQQVLSQRKGDNNYFASRPNEKLQQRYTKEELAQVPEIYKSYAKLIEEEEECN